VRLRLLRERFSVCSTARLPSADCKPFSAALRDADGYTWAGPEECAPAAVECRKGWRALEVEGPLPFELTGVLATLTAPLAEAGVSVFVLSTWATDVILFPEEKLEGALRALEDAGHAIAPL